MDRRISILFAAAAVSIICSATLLAITATRVTTPIYIAWLTTSLALFHICLCYAACTYRRAPAQRLESTLALRDDGGGTAVLRDDAAVEAGVEDPRNTYSLSTFYWCSPGLHFNAASASASRTPETVIHKPLQSSSGLLSSTMNSSPMPPGLPPAAYFEPSRVDIQTGPQLSLTQSHAMEVAPPMPTAQRW